MANERDEAQVPKAHSILRKPAQVKLGESPRPRREKKIFRLVRFGAHRGKNTDLEVLKGTGAVALSLHRGQRLYVCRSVLSAFHVDQ